MLFIIFIMATAYWKENNVIVLFFNALFQALMRSLIVSTFYIKTLVYQNKHSLIKLFMAAQILLYAAIVTVVLILQLDDGKKLNCNKNIFSKQFWIIEALNITQIVILALSTKTLIGQIKQSNKDFQNKLNVIEDVQMSSETTSKSQAKSAKE